MTKPLTHDDAAFRHAYSLLVHLDEHCDTLGLEAALCVMDAFSNLAEIDVPASLDEVDAADAHAPLIAAIDAVEWLIPTSEDLARTVALLRVSDLLRQAREIAA